MYPSASAQQAQQAQPLPSRQERIDQLVREWAVLNPGMSLDKLRSEAEARVDLLQKQQGGKYFSTGGAQQSSTTGGASMGQENWGVGEQPDTSQLPPNFDWKAYLDAPGNADLRAAGVDTPREAMLHYTKYGRNENRSMGAPGRETTMPTGDEEIPDIVRGALTGGEREIPR